MKPTTATPRLHPSLPVRGVRRLHLALLAGALTAAASAPLDAKTWQAGDGQWSDPGNWQGGVPTGAGGSTNNAEFPLIALHPALAVDVNIDAAATLLLVGRGQSVEFNIGNGRSLTLGSISRVGQAFGGSPQEGGALTVQGPTSGSGTTAFHQLFIQNGSTATFSGSNLQVTATSSLILGNIGIDNRVTVTNGAEVAVTGINLGHPTNGMSTHGNQITVTADSTLRSTGNNGVTLGSGATHHSNSATVSGENAVLEVQGGFLNIGNSSADNHGGNFLDVRLGGQVKTDRATQIYGFTTDGSTDHRANRLSIGAGGTFTSTSTIVNRGLLQLAEGGTLEAKTMAGDSAAFTITVSDGARFEAAGSGLDRNVTTDVSTGGRFAVGLEGASTASELTLDSAIHFSADSVLELTLFADGTIDTIDLLANGSMTGEAALIINGTAPVGSAWALFTGNTAGVDLLFDLSALDPLIWDTTQLNQAGGWQLTAIPEPSSTLLLTMAGIGYAIFRRKRATALSMR